MFETLLVIILDVLLYYLIIGSIFAVWYLFLGHIGSVDQGAVKISLFNKILFFPACVVFWLYLWIHWLKNKK